jgi:hypothetical protein
MATPLFRTESIVSTELIVFTTVTKAKGLVRTILQQKPWGPSSRQTG